MTKDEVLQTCYEDLGFLGKVISPQTYYLPSPEFHTEVDEILLDNTITQSVIEAPRGTAKSSKTIAKVIHHSIFDIGDKQVIIQSKTRPEAINRLTKIKNVFEYSEYFRDLFDPDGFATSVRALIWREDKISVRLKCPRDGNVYTITIKAIGTGMQVRGSLEGDTRITLFLLDDPDDEQSCLTKEQMDKNFDKFLGGIAGLDRRNGRVIVIGTPIREGCIVERLRNAPGWVTKKYQSYWTEGDEIKLLWAEMYDYQWLETKKAELKEVGKLSKFYSEYMCEIMGDEDRLFKYEDFRYYEGDFKVLNGQTYLFMDNKLKPVNVFLGIDPASSTKQSADYSVIMPVAYDSDKNIYILPYFRKRVSPLALVEAIIDAIKTFKPVRGHIETVGFQEMLRETVRARLNEEDLYLPGLELKFNPRTEKSARLEALQPYFAQHKVFMRKDMTELIDELATYPRASHDDLPDGLYYATRRLLPPDHEAEGTGDDFKYYPFQYIGKKNNWVRV